MSIDPSRLQVLVEQEDSCRRRLTVTVPADVVARERGSVLRGIAGRAKIPGFRQGKTPASVLEKRYGEGVKREVLDRLVRDAFRAAVEKESLSPISEGEVRDLHFEEGEDLVFEIAFDVEPEIRLDRLGGFAVERPKVEVTEEDVSKVLERLRMQHSVWVPAGEGTPESGDLVTVGITPLTEGEEPGEAREYEIVLGTGDAIPDVEAAILTLSPGEEGEFTVRFPDDFPNETRRGQEQRLRIRLESRKLRELPDLDDTFARTVGEFDGLDELEARVREDLDKEARAEADAEVRGRLLDYVVEANPFPVPRSMVDRYIRSVLGDTEGADPERVREIREQIRPQAERSVKRILVIERIAQSEGLAATEEEVDTRVEEIADRTDSSPAEVYARLQKAGRLDSIEREITERKVLEFLEARSEITQAA